MRNSFVTSFKGSTTEVWNGSSQNTFKSGALHSSPTSLHTLSLTAQSKNLVSFVYLPGKPTQSQDGGSGSEERENVFKSSSFRLDLLPFSGECQQWNNVYEVPPSIRLYLRCRAHSWFSVQQRNLVDEERAVSRRTREGGPGGSSTLGCLTGHCKLA